MALVRLISLKDLFDGVELYSWYGWVIILGLFAHLFRFLMWYKGELLL